MEELKELIKKRDDIDRKIGLKKIRKSIEMIKEGIDPNNIEELTLSDTELGGFLSLLKEDIEYYNQTRYYGELGDQTVRSGFYFKNNGVWIGIIQEYDERDEENGRITILEEAPSMYYDYYDEYEEDKEANEFVKNAVDIDFDLLENKINGASAKNIPHDIEDETIEQSKKINSLLDKCLSMPEDELDEILGDDDYDFWSLVHVKKQLLSLKQILASNDDKNISTYTFFTTELSKILEETNFNGWQRYGLYETPEDEETYDFCTTLYIDGYELTFNDWDGTACTPKIRKNEEQTPLDVTKVIQYIDTQLVELLKSKNITLSSDTHPNFQNIDEQTTKPKAQIMGNLLSIDELENMLLYIQSQNSGKTSELSQLQLTRQKELIEQIIAEQKKGQDLDAQLRDAKDKAQYRGE